LKYLQKLNKIILVFLFLVVFIHFLHLTENSFGDTFWFEISLSIEILCFYKALPFGIRTTKNQYITWDLLIFLYSDDIPN